MLGINDSILGLSLWLLLSHVFKKNTAITMVKIHSKVKITRSNAQLGNGNLFLFFNLFFGFSR